MEAQRYGACFERSDVIEMRNRIIFDFYRELTHMTCNNYSPIL